MSGLIGLFGGSSAKHDRQIELGGFKDLSNIFNFALPTAKGLTSAGGSDLGAASGYWNKLLSGNRADLQQANAPAINATLSATDAAKRQLSSMGTSRGGGVAGANQTINDRTRASIDNSLFASRAKAGEEVGRLGQVEMGDALNALGVAEGTAKDITSIAADSRVDSQKIHDSTVAQVQAAVSQLADAFGAFA